jgi:thiol-disulfide isomerase/thioredoxin
MKKFLPIITGILFSTSLLAQSQYEISKEADGTKILKGIINKSLIAADTNFKWFSENQKGFVPNAEAVTALKNKGGQLQFIVFAGTWCDDTKNLLPKYYSWLASAGFPEDRVTLIGVDRNKKTISHLSEAMGIINVPTFIVLKDGKEIGRVVEFGKYGAPDKELGEMIGAMK